MDVRPKRQAAKDAEAGVRNVYASESKARGFVEYKGHAVFVIEERRLLFNGNDCTGWIGVNKENLPPDSFMNNTKYKHYGRPLMARTNGLQQSNAGGGLCAATAKALSDLYYKKYKRDIFKFMNFVLNKNNNEFELFEELKKK